MYTKIKDIYINSENYLNKEIYVVGWVKTIRDNNNFCFIEINDGSFLRNLQIFVDNSIENFKSITKLGVGSSLVIFGDLVESQGANQSFELKAININVEGVSGSDYPLQKKRHSLEYLRNIAHLRPRTNTHSAIFRVRSLISFAIHKFFVEKGFVNVHTPIITGSDTEGAGEMFKVTTLEFDKKSQENFDYKDDFFGKMAGLTVSGQLSAESFASAFGSVYTFGPTFRAENSNTTRHAAEFWMIEPEIAFADLNDDMDLAEEMLKYIVKYVLDNAKEEMEFFNKFIDKELLDRLNNVVNSDFERITYTQAIQILKESGAEFEFPVEWGIDLQTEHERYITETIYKKPVFLTDYPKDIKAFYMRLNDDNKTVAAMDLLVPGIGELIGGSQREERFDMLENRMNELGLNTDDYWWYLDLRKYGTVKHAGFGLGFERCVMYITGISNIRDVIPFPRTVNNLEF